MIKNEIKKKISLKNLSTLNNEFLLRGGKMKYRNASSLQEINK